MGEPVKRRKPERRGLRGKGTEGKVGGGGVHAVVVFHSVEDVAGGGGVGLTAAATDSGEPKFAVRFKQARASGVGQQPIPLPFRRGRGLSSLVHLSERRAMAVDLEIVDMASLRTIGDLRLPLRPAPALAGALPQAPARSLPWKPRDADCPTGKVRVAVHRVGRQTVRSMLGEWQGGTAGGSLDHASWTQNPQYVLTVAASAFVTLRLRALVGAQCAFGLYLFKVAGIGELFRRRKLGQADVLRKGKEQRWMVCGRPFLHVQVNLQPGYYVLVPCTEDPGVDAAFEVLAGAPTSAGLRLESFGENEIESIQVWGEQKQSSVAGAMAEAEAAADARATKAAAALRFSLAGAKTFGLPDEIGDSDDDTPPASETTQPLAILRQATSPRKPRSLAGSPPSPGGASGGGGSGIYLPPLRSESPLEREDRGLSSSEAGGPSSPRFPLLKSPRSSNILSLVHTNSTALSKDSTSSTLLPPSSATKGGGGGEGSNHSNSPLAHSVQTKATTNAAELPPAIESGSKATASLAKPSLQGIRTEGHVAWDELEGVGAQWLQMLTREVLASQPPQALAALEAGGDAAFLARYKGSVAQAAAATLGPHSSTALHAAALEGKAELVAAYVAKAPRDWTLVHAVGYGALQMAARLGHTKVLRVLVEAGAPLTLTDGLGRGLLHLAAFSSSLDAVKYLLRKGGGAALLHADAEGRTPLMAAARRGWAEAVDVLLDVHKAGVAAVDVHRRSALHYAAQAGSTDVVKALLAAGAEPGRRDEAGETAVYQAAVLGHLDSLRLLLPLAAESHHHHSHEDARTPALTAVDSREEPPEPLQIHHAAGSQRQLVTLYLTGGAAASVVATQANASSSSEGPPSSAPFGEGPNPGKPEGKTVGGGGEFESSVVGGVEKANGGGVDLNSFHPDHGSLAYGGGEGALRRTMDVLLILAKSGERHSYFQLISCDGSVKSMSLLLAQTRETKAHRRRTRSTLNKGLKLMAGRRSKKPSDGGMGGLGEAEAESSLEPEEIQLIAKGLLEILVLLIEKGDLSHTIDEGLTDLHYSVIDQAEFEQLLGRDGSIVRGDSTLHGGVAGGGGGSGAGGGNSGGAGSSRYPLGSLGPLASMESPQLSSEEDDGAGSGDAFLPTSSTNSRSSSSHTSSSRKPSKPASTKTLSGGGGGLSSPKENRRSTSGSRRQTTSKLGKGASAAPSSSSPTGKSKPPPSVRQIHLSLLERAPGYLLALLARTEDVTLTIVDCLNDSRRRLTYYGRMELQAAVMTQPASWMLPDSSGLGVAGLLSVMISVTELRGFRDLPSSSGVLRGAELEYLERVHVFAPQRACHPVWPDRVPIEMMDPSAEIRISFYDYVPASTFSSAKKVLLGRVLISCGAYRSKLVHEWYKLSAGSCQNAEVRIKSSLSLSTRRRHPTAASPVVQPPPASLSSATSIAKSTKKLKNPFS